MNSITSRRISTGVWWGAFLVLAWAACTLFFSAGTAHAEEDADGPLDGVTSLIGTTVSAGSDLVADAVEKTVPPILDEVAPVPTETVPEVVDVASATVTTVVEKVAPVVAETVPEVVAPVTKVVSATVDEVPVVRDVVLPVVAPVTHVATKAVTEIAAPVTQLLHEAPVSPVIDPIVDVASNVPVIGDVLEDVGVADAATEIAAVLDATTGAIGSTVEVVAPAALTTVENLPSAYTSVVTDGNATPSGPRTSAPAEEFTSAESLLPAPLPASPTSLTTPASLTITHTAVMVDADTRARFAALLAVRYFDEKPAVPPTVVSEADTSGEPTVPAQATHAPPASPAPTPSAGHGGGSIGDVARPGDAPVDSLRVSKRALGAVDDDIPCSPVAETDSSPD